MALTLTQTLLILRFQTQKERFQIQKSNFFFKPIIIFFFPEAYLDQMSRCDLVHTPGQKCGHGHEQSPVSTKSGVATLERKATAHGAGRSDTSH